MTTPLDREVRKALVRLAEQNAEYRQAARIVLLLDAGRDIEQIAAAVKAPLHEVGIWRDRYAQQGLMLFAGALPNEMLGNVSNARPTSATTPTESQPTLVSQPPPASIQTSPISPLPASEPTSTVIPTAEPSLFDGLPELPEYIPPKPTVATITEALAPKPPRPPEPILPYDAPNTEQPISIGALAASFDIDMRQARHISRQLRELFDITINSHRLHSHIRDLLHAIAILQGIAQQIDPDDYAVRGRNILLHYQLKELTEEDRNLIAVVIGLQQPEAIVQQDIAFQNLSSEQQGIAETMIALVRIGLALDNTQSQASFIADHHQVPGEITIVIGGTNPSTDAAAAQNASRRWNTLFSTPKLRFITEDQAQTDVDLEELAISVTLSPHDYSIEASNKLREHHANRLDYLASRIQRNDTGLLLPFWREFQRIIGVWQWLLPGSKPRQVFNEDTEWLQGLINDALFFATLEDRSIGLVNETDPTEDDPAAIRDLKTLAIHHAEQSTNAYESLRDGLRSRRYERWLGSLRLVQLDEQDTLTFGSQVGVRAWAYLGELRSIIDYVNAAGMNADLEELLTLDVVYTFEADLRHLTDLLLYSMSLLGTEIQQVLQVLEPLSDYVQAWHRMEMVAQFAEQQQNTPPADVSPFVSQAYAMIMRERANELRWGLANMWESIESASFRRALALAVAKP